MSGRLLVVEGLDGSGKATQTALLCRALEEMGNKVRRVSFPDYEQPSSALVRMYLGGEFGADPAAVNAYAASSFYAVDRFASYVRFWKADYESGAVIVADRYATSNMIYQLEKLPENERDSFLHWLEDFEYCKLGIPRPDFVLYLDMPPEISQRLLSERYGGDEAKKDIHEKNRKYLENCRASAQYAAQKLGWQVINCACGDHPKTIEEIHGEVMRRIKGVF